MRSKGIIFLIAFLLLIAGASLFVYFYQTRTYDTEKIQQDKQIVVKSAKIIFPNASSLRPSSVESIPVSIRSLIVDISGQTTVRTIRYNDGTNGLYIEYDSNASLSNLYGRIETLLRDEPLSMSLEYESKAELFAMEQATNTQYTVSVNMSALSVSRT